MQRKLLDPARDHVPLELSGLRFVYVVAVRCKMFTVGAEDNLTEGALEENSVYSDFVLGFQNRSHPEKFGRAAGI